MMPTIAVPEDQILQSLDQLSPQARRQAIKRLLPSAAYLERAVERNRPRMEALAKQRGLDWDALTEDQKEQLIDQVLHE
ncbi:MAG: hypothetical protein AABP62_30420 [Planctomycetota bacterium]